MMLNRFSFVIFGVSLFVVVVVVFRFLGFKLFVLSIIEEMRGPSKLKLLSNLNSF